MLHDTISPCDNLTAAETAFQRRSQVETILNVPHREGAALAARGGRVRGVRLRLFLPGGLARGKARFAAPGWAGEKNSTLFEQPVTQPERH